MVKKLTIRQRAIVAGYRSGLEETISLQLASLSVPVLYETEKIRYEVNEVRTYTPDFKLPNGIIIESKGRFVAADRKKHLLIQKQHIFLDIRFVFSNSKAKLTKGSKTTYGDWCKQHGFKFSDKTIPKEWLDE